MKKYNIPNTTLEVSRLAYGCMKIGGAWSSEPLGAQEKKMAVDAVMAAYESGINFFDHADIYCRGRSEQVFSEMWNVESGFRDKIYLQTKCAIRFRATPREDDPGRYDFSRDHIISSVEGSLKRLNTDYIDVLLLHRPDPLAEPEEVASAFDELYNSGKVRYFGVSNHHSYQIALLKKYVNQPIVVNQVELNILHSFLINDGVIFDRAEPSGSVVSGTLDYMRLNDIFVQAYSPVARGLLTGYSDDVPQNVKDTFRLIEQLAREKQTTTEAIALAWILRHPAGIQPVIGTTKPERIRASAQADDVELTREEWYKLFIAARGNVLP